MPFLAVSAVFLDARGAVLIAFLTLTVLATRCSCTVCSCRCALRDNKTLSEACDLIRTLKTSEDGNVKTIAELVKTTTVLTNRFNNISEEKQVTKELLKRVEKQNMQSKAEVLDRLRETESRLNETDRLILTKIQEAIDELSGKVQETTASLTTKLENLQAKMKKIKNTVSTLLASQSELNNEIRTNLSPSVQHLKAYTEEHFTELKQVGGNMTVKIRQFEDSLLMLEQELSNCAPLANFSNLDRTVREQASASSVEHQSLRSEMSLRVAEVRQQCADRDDVARMNWTLSSLSTDLNGMRRHLEMVKEKVLKPKCKDTLPLAKCKRKVEQRLCRSEYTATHCCASCDKALY